MDSPLHRLARTRHGVLLTREAERLGYDGDFFRRIVRSEGWCQLFRGAYLLPGHEPSLRAYVAAIQARWPDLVASHATAGVLWGLAGCAEHLVVTGPDQRRTAPAGCRYARDLLPDEDVALLADLRVTTPTRTAVDLLLTEERDRAVIALDSALQRGLTSLPEVAEMLERKPTRDTRLSRAWRGFRCTDGAAESPVETKARLNMYDAGLSVRTQVPVRIGNRTRRMDFLVEGVFLETEGTTYHGGKADHLRDVRRFNELTMAGDGRPILRATRDDIFERWPTTLAMIRRTSATWRARQNKSRGGAV